MTVFDLVHLTLLLGGPIVGYRAAMRQVARTRWLAIAWSAAGGAVAALVFISAMLLIYMAWFATLEQFLRQTIPLIGGYALFGLVLGFVGVATHGMRRGLAIIALADIALVIALINIANDAAAIRLAERSAKGRVFGPGNRLAHGVPVFVDRGVGPVERERTGMTGDFRVPLEPSRYGQLTLLICAPTAMPQVVRPVGNLLAVYNLAARPSHVHVQTRLRVQGWRPPIPDECLSGPAPIDPEQRIGYGVPGMERRTASAAVVSGEVTPPRLKVERVVSQRTYFVHWPHELAPRAPALVDGIERDFGERPRMITFTGRDTIEVSFWNPRFWANDMQSTELPQDPLLLIRKAANHVAGYVWTTFGRDAGINIIRIAFTRARRENVVGSSKHVPAQEAIATFTRPMLEPGPPDVKDIGVSQRDYAPIRTQATKIESAGATTQPASPQQDAFVRGPRALADRGLALVETIGHDFGQRPRELSFTGKDTIDVTFWNPAFWHEEVPPEEFQKVLLPLVGKAAEQVGAVVWTNYGRDAGINVIRVTFIRMRKESSPRATRDVPAEEVTGVLARKPLETGPPKLVRLTMTQR